MTRERAVHYQQGRYADETYTRCGGLGWTTRVMACVTCRVCKFGILADAAPWARAFLDDLRKNVRERKPAPVTIPRATAEPVNGVVEGGGARLGRPFTQQAGSKKAIGELLTVTAALLGPVQPVVERGGAAAEPVGVQPGEVTEDAGYARQVGDKPGRDFDPSEVG